MKTNNYKIEIEVPTKELIKSFSQQTKEITILTQKIAQMQKQLSQETKQLKTTTELRQPKNNIQELMKSMMQLEQKTNQLQTTIKLLQMSEQSSTELQNYEATIMKDTEYFYQNLSDLHKDYLQNKQQEEIKTETETTQHIDDIKTHLNAKNRQRLQNDSSNTIEALKATSKASASLFSKIATDADSMASFSKAMTAFQIGLDTAKALSGAVSSSQMGLPFPANLAAMATSTTKILATVAKVKKLLSSSNSPTVPTFARGGTVHGIGTETSDSIVARLSNGESVLTAKATKMFAPIISAFNQIGGGVPVSSTNKQSEQFGEDMLTRAFSRALQNMPQPNINVRDIATVEQKIQRATKIY